MRLTVKQAALRIALALGVIGMVVAFDGATFTASADDQAPAQVKCRKAEVNPVTGHVLCLDPVGAPVDPPPAAELPPCKPGARSDEAWSYGPKCRASGSGP